nr:hypothetical protein [Pseudomonas sp. UBA6562]
MRVLMASVWLVLLGGCASPPTSIQEADPVPADELYAFQSKLLGKSGKLSVVRDSGFVGSGCDVVVYIDGLRAAKVGPGQIASFYLAAGRPNLGVGLAETGLCTGMAVRTITADVQVNQEVFYRISGDMSGAHIGPYIDYK